LATVAVWEDQGLATVTVGGVSVELPEEAQATSTG